MSLNEHQFKRFYHGTSDQNAEKIMKEGLKAHNPAEEINMEYGEPPDTVDEGHPPGVYFGDNIDTARGYGYAVLSVDLPERHPNWGWTESEGHVWTADIPHYFIRRVE